MSTIRRRQVGLVAWTIVVCGAAVLSACDNDCEPEANGGNQDPVSLEVCPPLPSGIEPIEGLVTATVRDRFGGLVVTLSDRPLECGDPGAQHGYCGEGSGLTMSLSSSQSTAGAMTLADAIYVEFETPLALAVGGGGDLDQATVELYDVTDTCVTGRIHGLAERGGPFDGGFQAPRCTP